MIVDSCPSTQILAKELAERGCPHGEWISAREQTQGIGRKGRAWVGLAGNLFLSIVIRYPLGKEMGWIPLVTGLGVIEAIRQVNLNNSVKIKWPNDLMRPTTEGIEKVGGILCQGTQDYCVIGIGLNCKSAPIGIDQRTGALGLEVDVLRPRVVECVLKEIEGLKNAGPVEMEQLRDRLENSLIHGVGSTLKLEGRGNEQFVFLGIGSRGELKVRPKEKTGEAFSVVSGDVFMAPEVLP